MSKDAVVKKKKTSSGFHFVAGLGSGVASAFLLQPADLLKTRVQQSQSTSLRQALQGILNGPNPVRQLWRGTLPSTIRTGFGSALYFGLLNNMRQSLSSAAANASGTPATSSSSVLPKLGNLANLFTGALARVAAGFVLNPITVLKVRYESTQYSYTSLVGAARDVFAKEGARGFFAGFGATAVRDAPYAGLYVVIYEQSKTYLGTASSTAAAAAAKAAALATGGNDGLAERIPQTMTSSATINFASGLLAAVSATTLTNPFDAIKTRLQLNPGKYRNMFQAAQMMLRHEGIQSMFYGLSLRIGRKAISSALTWTVYEEFIRRAERALDKQNALL